VGGQASHGAGEKTDVVTRRPGLARDAAEIAGATILSRILGFVRDILVAAALGAGPVADAFVVALRLPTLMRRFLAEGAFNTAFLPLLEEARGEGRADGFASEIFSLIAAAALAVTAVAVLAMPAIVGLIAPGLAGGGNVALAVELSRITFPACLATALMIVAAGILNASGRFLASALAPALLNAVLLVAWLGLWMGGAAGTAAARILAWALLAGSVAQAVLVFGSLLGAGLRLRLGRPRFSAQVRRFLALAGPGVVAAGITQVNPVVAMLVASGEPGAVTWLYYADRVYQLPLGIIGVVVGMAVLPALLQGPSAADAEHRRAAFSRAVEATLFLALPAAVGLAVAGPSIAAVLFGRGAFSVDDAAATGTALSIMAAGLPAFVVARLLQSLFFARAEVRAPFLIALVGIAADLSASLLLFPPAGHLGIAAACALSGWVNAVALLATARRRGLVHLDGAARRRLPRMLAATAAMGATLALLAPAIEGLPATMALLAWGGGGLASYLGATLLFGAADIAGIASSMRGKGTPPS
jgi:putative peptidoglycan lipid II flippase